MALKFDHGTQLGLEGSVSRAPMFLEAIAFLPLLSFRSCVQGDLSQMIKLLFGLDGDNRRRRERVPGGLKLRVELLELGCRRRETLNLKAPKITKFFVKPRGGLRMRQGHQGGETDQDWSARPTHNLSVPVE